MLFPVQATEYVFRRDGAVTTVGRTSPGASASINFSIDDNDGRWVTVRSAQYNAAADPVMAPGTHFTVGFYMKPHAGVCAPRKLQLDLYAGTGSSTPPQAGAEVRVVLYRYLHSDVLPGKSASLAALLDTPQANGGLMPDWECNR